MTPEMEYRTLPLEVRSAEKDNDDEPLGLVKGYASTYAKDAYGDRVSPGAFAESIREHRGKYPLLQSHDAFSQPIGFTTSLVEDHKGLLMEARLALNTTAGRDAFGLLQTAKAVDYRMGLSIGFICRQWEMDEDVRVLTDIDLKEVSLTAFPANRMARILDARSIRAGTIALDSESLLRAAIRHEMRLIQK